MNVHTLKIKIEIFTFRIVYSTIVLCLDLSWRDNVIHERFSLKPLCLFLIFIPLREIERERESEREREIYFKET